MIRDSDHYKKFFDDASTGIYHTLFENSNDAILIYSHFKILKYNKKAVALFGFSDKHKYYSLNNIFPEYQPDGARSIVKARHLIRRVLKGESMLFDWLHKKVSGEEFYSEVSLNRLDIGIDGCFQAIIRDISEFVRHKNNEARFHRIFDNAPVGIARTSPDGKLLLANQKLAEIFDFPNPEFMMCAINNLVDNIYPSPQIRYNVLESLRLSGKHRGTYQITTHNGHFRTLQLNAIAVYSQTGGIEFIDSIVEDITDKTNLEISLKERETILSSIINSLPFELWVCNHQGKILCQSAASINYYGNCTGCNYLELSLSDEAKDRWTEKSSRVLQGEVIHSDNHSKIQGHDYYFHHIMAPLTDGNVVEGVISLSIDVTAQKIAEENLQKSEEKYRSLMENMNEVVMMVDNNDRVLYVNRRFTEVFGYETAEIVGKIGYEILLDPDERSIIVEINKKRAENIISQYEISFKAKNGQKIDFLVSGAPIYDGDKIVGSIGSMTDITERKKIEKALKESEEMFRRLVDLTPYSIVVTDMKGHLLMVNKNFCKATGLKPEQIIGKTSAEIGYKSRPLIIGSIDKELREKGFVDNIEAEILGVDSSHYILLSSRVIQMNNKPAILTSTVDITEKRKIQFELEKHKTKLEELVRDRTEEIETLNQELIATNEELYQNNEELNALNEALAIQKKQLEEAIEQLKKTQMQLVQSEKMASIGILTAGIAHEINNPVNFISSGILGLELVINDILKVAEEYSMHCERFENCKRKDILLDVEKKHNLQGAVENITRLFKSIHVGVERTTNIVKSLRTFSRLDSESKTLSNIHELIDSSLTILNNKIKDRIEVVKDYKLKEFINCYPGKMSQVFMNLLINSIQSIEDVGIITIITKKDRNGRIELVFRDTGVGMCKEIQSKIFDPFFTTKPVGEGTGMGLSIVHGIIKDHNGDIVVSSKPGKGTEFRIILPAN